MQVRNLDSAVQDQLRRAAEKEGVSLSEFLRRRLTELARNLEVHERAAALNPVQRALGGPLRGLEHVDSGEIVRMIREDRDGR